MVNRLALCALVSFVCPFESQAAEATVVLDQLMKGNERYVAGKMTRPNQSARRRTAIKSGEKPVAVVLSCSDSRVPPEIIFDQGLGDLYVVRVAGNVVNDEVLGSIEYAVANLDANLVIVMGHDDCSAVKSAIAGGHAGNHVQAMVEAIKPAIAGAKDIPSASAANVRSVVRELSESKPDLQSAVQRGELKIFGAEYHLDTGRVEILH
ncbi:MAG: carbonic anhydrase [Bryobacteraceae bacterium]